MGFHEVRFPTSLSFGAVGGPERRTEIVSLSNGFEERNTPWEHSRRRYDAGLGVRSLDDLHAVIAFFEARRGQLNAFRWKDWGDSKSCAPSAAIAGDDQQIGLGDGQATTFQLVKRYVSGTERYERPIRKPVAARVLVALDGIEAASGWTVDPTTGIVRFDTAPPVGAVVSAGYEFDVPVRFDTDVLRVSIEGFQAGEVPDVPVVEVRV